MVKNLPEKAYFIRFQTNTRKLQKTVPYSAVMSIFVYTTTVHRLTIGKTVQINIQHIEPTLPLRPIVAKLCIFQSTGKMTDADTKLVVPNGMAKLIIPFRNGLVGRYDNWLCSSKESSITLVGLSDLPATVDIESDSPHGSIIVEFTPAGAYRLFNLRQAELKNRIYLLEEIFGKPARDLQERIANVVDVFGKLQIVQDYLTALLLGSEQDPILDYCLQYIRSSNGLVTVAQLEKKTGYSSRWLHEKFSEKVGLSPKTLSSVIRFMHFYTEWAKNPTSRFYQNNIYDYFHDQAHFIKNFKRFTGLTPDKFRKSNNEFGRSFYKQ